MEIAILLATYNSERYLAEQLNSLFAQSYKNFHLYIRDDGSNDGTIDIIKEYQKKYSNIILFNDSIRGRGAAGSFMWLLEHCEAEYYMFCDHDDVWLPQKIESSFSKIMEFEDREIPALVCTDLCVVDKELNVTNKSMWNLMKQRPDILIKRRYASSSNLFTGCTMIINDAAKKISLPMSSNSLMHDRWIGLRVIANNGNVGYITEPHILYRQHGNNVCGVSKVGGLNYIKSKIISLKELSEQWKQSYYMSRDAYNGKLSYCHFLFYKFLYLIIR